MAGKTFDPSVTQKDNAAFWAAVFVVATQNGNRERAKQARERLRAFGFHISYFSGRRGKAVAL